MNRFATRIAFAALVGCVSPPPPAPKPMAVTVDLAPEEVLQRVSRVIAESGWSVMVLDGGAGILRAERTARRAENEPWLRCEGNFGSSPESIGTQKMTSTVEVTVTVTEAETETTVRVVGRVTEAVSTALGDDMHFDCVSSGAIENAIAEALES